MQSNAFIGLGTFQALAYFRRGLFYFFLSLYIHFFLGMSITESTLFVTFSMLASSLGQATIWGWVADRLFNRKYMIVWSEIIAALGHIIVWWLHKLSYDIISPIAAAWTITIGLTVVESIWSASNVGWSALVSDLSAHDERSSVMGKLSAIGGLGHMGGIFVASFFYAGGEGFFSGIIFFLTSLIIIITAIVIYIFIKDDALVYRHDSKEQPSASNSSSVGLVTFNKNLFIIFLIGLAFINFGRNSIVLISNFFLIERFSASDFEIGLIGSITSVSIILAGISTPFLVKKLSDWGLFLSSCLLVVSSLILYVLSPVLILVYIITIGIWVVHVTIEATSYSIVSSLIPAEIRGKYLGMYNVSFFLSWGLGGTLLTGPIADSLISLNFNPVFAYMMAFFAAAGCVMIGFFITLYLYLYRFAKSQKIRYAISD